MAMTKEQAARMGAIRAELAEKEAAEKAARDRRSAAEAEAREHRKRIAALKDELLSLLSSQ